MCVHAYTERLRKRQCGRACVHVNAYVRAHVYMLVCACIGSWSIAERMARDGDGYYSVVVVVVVVVASS